MRVCLAATTFPRWAGDGQGAFVWGLAQALAHAGVTVKVVALHTPGAAVHETIDGIEVHRPRYWWREEGELLRKEGGGLPVTLRRYPLARLQLFPFLAVFAQAIARAAQQSDLVHAHWTLSAGAAILSRPLHRRPVLATVQGSDVFQVPQLPLGARFTRGVLNRCAIVTTLTEALRRAALATGVEEARIRVIANGVNVAEFTPAPEHERTKTILFVGFLIKRKGVDFLLDALPAVLAHLPDYRLVLVGEGPEEETLRRQAEQLGIAHAVEFTGFLPQAEVRRWMRTAQVLVLPSREEGQGVVLLEALASGTPVIGSDVDGIAEVIDERVGALTPAGASAHLAAAITALLADRATWRAKSEAARQRALARYDWRNLAADYLALYETLNR